MNNPSKFFNNKEDIQSWLEKMNIKNYTINDSLIVDVNGNVDLRKKKLDFLPIQFGVVNGFFDISDNHLVSFKGSPHEIVAGFNCTNNKLSSLDYAPKKTTKFFCYNNPIKINH